MSEGLTTAFMDFEDVYIEAMCMYIREFNGLEIIGGSHL